MSFKPFVAPVTGANWKQHTCAEFDEALDDFRNAMERLFQVGFSVDHALSEAPALVADDPETYGHRAEDITEDPGLRARAELFKCSIIPGDNDLLGSVFFRLYDMMEARFHRLELPAPTQVPDNDEPQCLGIQLLMTCAAHGCYQSYRVMGYKRGGGDSGSGG